MGLIARMSTLLRGGPSPDPEQALAGRAPGEPAEPGGAAERPVDEAIELLHLEVSELRRIVAGQVDAADQSAEVLGRALTHLAAEAGQLSERLDGFFERLDGLFERFDRLLSDEARPRLP